MVLFGPPGVGKGTQCRRLVERFGWDVISTGEILREAVREQSPLGKAVQAKMAAGELIDDATVVGLVEARLARGGPSASFIFDGFPRTIAQAQALEALLDRLDRRIDKVITLHADDQELTRRILGRAQIESRADDTPETVANRLHTYHRDTEPLIEYYLDRGVLESVDGMRGVDEVFESICEAISRTNVIQKGHSASA